MDNVLHTSVLVIGAGIAGVTAALQATSLGEDCTLAATSDIFSGASFFPGTWGFGLIGPENPDDADNLLDTILRVGMGMANKTLAEKLVQDIPKRVRALEDMGLSLRRPRQKGEREFIPCFDYKNRDWYGVVQSDAKKVFGKALTQRNVRLCPDTQILALRKENGRVCGALAMQSGKLLEIVCKSVVIATGGLAGLYRYAFGSMDCCGMGQLLALEAGAELINMEFQQMMPGFISPCPGTIYNEKVFRCTSFIDTESGQELFEDLSATERESLLECRSGHGPFTSRLPSKEVDLRIFSRFMQNASRITLCYDNKILHNPPEFVKVYFDWLREEKGLTPEDEVHLGIFYHAANGGIRIDENGFTGVEGLYACGESTGGMHGADRLGGLSIANGLVFGAIAGENAAICAKRQLSFAAQGWKPEIPLYADAEKRRDWLRQENFAAQMLARSENNVTQALSRVKSAVELSAGTWDGRTDGLVSSRRLCAATLISEAVLRAILMRKESRGSHYRPEYQQENELFKKTIVSRLDVENSLCAAWSESD